MSLGCKVCDDKAVCLLVDRYLEQNITYATIARTLALGGSPVSADVVSKHAKHRVPSVNPDVKATKRDAALIIKGKVLDALESKESNPDFDILDKELQPALKTALAAQALEDKREQKKVTQNFWLNLYTGQQGELAQLDDGNTIEGKFDVVDA